MKYAFVLLIPLLVVTAAAQPGLPALGPSFNFGIHGNFTSAKFPGPSVNGSTALKDVYGAGWGGGVHMDVGFTVISARLSADFLRFSPDNDKYRQGLESIIGTAAGQFSVDGGGITFLSLTANGKWSILPLPIVSPYFTGGIGLARISVDDATVKQGGNVTKAFAGFASDTRTAFNVGAGVDLNIGVKLFLEVRYTWVLTDPETSTLVPVTLGVTF